MLRALVDGGITAFRLEAMPRISRAQDMDVLSSMATLAGYHAAVMAAVRLPRIFPLMMTAAGTITPARALVLGAGVAGLQAIATCRRLGAVVEAFDVRPAVRDQVESLGARFVETGVESDTQQDTGGYARELEADAQARQAAVLAEHVKESDVVISTAQIPNRKAPILVTADMVATMRTGSVIVDLAAPGGGNCELTKPDEEVNANGVLILGPDQPPRGDPRSGKPAVLPQRHALPDADPEGRSRAPRLSRTSSSARPASHMRARRWVSRWKRCCREQRA